MGHRFDHNPSHPIRPSGVFDVRAGGTTGTHDSCVCPGCSGRTYPAGPWGRVARAARVRTRKGGPPRGAPPPWRGRCPVQAADDLQLQELALTAPVDLLETQHPLCLAGPVPTRRWLVCDHGRRSAARARDPVRAPARCRPDHRHPLPPRCIARHLSGRVPHRAAGADARPMRAFTLRRVAAHPSRGTITTAITTRWASKRRDGAGHE